jgi:hypothetical protein
MRLAEHVRAWRHALRTALSLVAIVGFHPRLRRGT